MVKSLTQNARFNFINFGENTFSLCRCNRDPGLYLFHVFKKVFLFFYVFASLGEEYHRPFIWLLDFHNISTVGQITLLEWFNTIRKLENIFIIFKFENIQTLLSYICKAFSFCRKTFKRKRNILLWWSAIIVLYVNKNYYTSISQNFAKNSKRIDDYFKRISRLFIIFIT